MKRSGTNRKKKDAMRYDRRKSSWTRSSRTVTELALYDEREGWRALCIMRATVSYQPQPLPKAHSSSYVLHLITFSLRLLISLDSDRYTVDSSNTLTTKRRWAIRDHEEDGWLRGSMDFLDSILFPLRVHCYWHPTHISSPNTLSPGCSPHYQRLEGQKQYLGRKSEWSSQLQLTRLQPRVYFTINFHWRNGTERNKMECLG